MKDLKLLVKDYPVSCLFSPPSQKTDEQALIENGKPIAKNALTILINISNDTDVLGLLAEDDAFIETLLVRVTVCQVGHAHTIQHTLSARSLVALYLWRRC